MTLKLSESNQAVSEFRRNLPKFQQTFLTPMEDLPRFVRALLSPWQVEGATITIDQVVFEPTELLALCASLGIQAVRLEDSQLTVIGSSEASDLLIAALSGWVDFLFIPVPAGFAIFADHDEFTTAFSSDEASLNRISSSVGNAGFKRIAGYTRFSQTAGST